jgi:hypothetical protein
MMSLSDRSDRPEGSGQSRKGSGRFSFLQRWVWGRKLLGQFPVLVAGLVGLAPLPVLTVP